MQPCFVWLCWWVILHGRNIEQAHRARFRSTESPFLAISCQVTQKPFRCLSCTLFWAAPPRVTAFFHYPEQFKAFHSAKIHDDNEDQKRPSPTYSVSS